MSDKYSPVRNYFELTKQIREQREKGEDYSEIYTEREKLKPKVQKVLADDTREAVSDLLQSDVEIDFSLKKMPCWLTVSRKDRLEAVKWEYAGYMNDDERKALKKKFEDEGYAADVWKVGGRATTPIILDEDMPHFYVLQSLGHETAHHYFFGKPLGKNYGESRECTVINETSANIVGDGVRDYRLSKMPERARLRKAAIRGMQKEKITKERLGKIVQTVEGLLSEEKIGKAETYMESERKKLNKEYDAHMETLNQATVVTFKTYGFDSKNGITKTLNDLRFECPDLKDFADTVGQTASYKQVEGALQQKRGDNEYYAFRALGGYSDWNARGRSGGR